MTKDQEAGRLLSNLGIRTSLSQIPLLLLFCFKKNNMNKIMSKFLLAGDKFMPERRPRFNYIISRLFTKKSKRIG